MPDMNAWSGPTYYGREQVKAAPFNNWLVGSYIFLSGLSGAAMLLSSLLDFSGRRDTERAVARGRYLALLGPTIGTVMLVSDLHTPKRFYNMLRLFKATSPMSIGSWTLVAFALFSTPIALAQRLLGRRPGLAVRVAQVPAALAGAGLATYTASLLSATSTPLWAAAPCATAVRFAASSVASGAAALSLGEGGRSRLGRDLDRVAVLALATELAATIAADERYRQTGVAPAMRTLPGMVEEAVAGGPGMVLPLGLHLASLMLLPRRSKFLSTLASAAVLGGSATFRIAFLAAGDESARRPDISLRFARPRRRSR